MSPLISRFPSVRRLEWPDGTQGSSDGVDPEDLAHFIEPYVQWELLELDSNSTDILLGEPASAQHDGHARELVILGGEVAQAWLRNAGKTTL